MKVKKHFLCILMIVACACLLVSCALFGSGSDEEEDTGEHKHVYGEWAVYREATCVDEGIDVRECACGDKKFRHVLPKGHTEVYDAAYAPTCVKEGKTSGSHCSVCGAIIREQGSIPATNRHTYDDDGKCIVCGQARPCAYGLTFMLNKNGTEYTVTASDGTYEDVIVPAEYDYIPVTAIAAEVFKGQTNLKSIVVSEGIKKIGSSLCEGCTALKTAVLPKSAELIDSYAFAKCSALEEITIPFVGSKPITGNYDDYQFPLGCYFGIAPYEGGEATEQRFYYKKPKNYDLESEYLRRTYYIPKSLKKVTVTKTSPTGGAFMNCKNLTEIVLPEDVTSIKTYVFYGCTGLTSYVIPDTVTEVQMSAFENCVNLTRLTLGSGIGKYSIMNDKGVFKNCYKLVEIYNKTRLTLTPGSAEYSYLAYYAKYITKNAADTRISFINDMPVYTDGEDVVLLGRFDQEETVIVPDTVTEINSFAFCGNTALMSVTIPASVKKISKNAFSGCEALAEVTFAETDGWMVMTGCEESGESVDATDSAQNATYLTVDHVGKIWIKGE